LAMKPMASIDGCIELGLVILMLLQKRKGVGGWLGGMRGGGGEEKARGREIAGRLELA
jgi:preprotein translocase subunit SecG